MVGLPIANVQLMAVALLDATGHILWADLVHPDLPEEQPAIGTRAWDWQPEYLRERGRLLFADALLFGQSGPQKIAVEVAGREHEQIVTYQHVPNAAVVCTWQEFADVHLTEREMAVLTLLCDDLAPRHIARTLGISVSTVDTYRAALRRKLNVRSIAGKVRWAIRAGLIRP